MNNIYIYILKVLRHSYTILIGSHKYPNPYLEKDANKVSEDIYNLLSSDSPCMIARFGCTELSCIANYISINSCKHSPLKYIKGEIQSWWWNRSVMQQMREWSGFFPTTEENLNNFCELMIEDMKYVDYLGGWYDDEIFIEDKIKNVPKCVLGYLDPFFSKLPWTRVLENKKVLVIHPFIKTIEKQYTRREKLFKNPLILPLFELKTIKAVQSIGGDNNEYKDWFDALSWMESEMDKIDYDIVLIGCGAYGFPLAAHAKRMGKKAVHL